MKKHIKLFEDFHSKGDNQICCDPISMLDSFEQGYGDSLRLALYMVQEMGFEQAEVMAEDPEDAQAVRMLKSMTRSSGVSAMGMLDLLEDYRNDLDEFRGLLFTFLEGEDRSILKSPEGRRFIRRMETIIC